MYGVNDPDLPAELPTPMLYANLFLAPKTTAKEVGP